MQPATRDRLEEAQRRYLEAARAHFERPPTPQHAARYADSLRALLAARELR